MPIIIAQLARTVIMALTTSAAVTAVQQFVDGTFIKLVEAIRDEHGLSLDEAKDIFVNILVDLAVNATIIGTVLKTRIAVKTADYLGLTTKGLTKRTLTTKAAAAVKKMDGPWEKFKAMGLVSKILTGGGVLTGLTWVAMGFANIVEPGIYQPRQANNLWEKILGIRPFPEPPSKMQPANYSAEAFAQLASSLENAGIKGIENPVARQSQVYSREGLSDLIEYVYGQAIVNQVKVSDHRDITKLIAPYLIGATPSSDGKTASTGGGSAAIVTPSVKVFTGVVSQGMLGTGTTFTERQDDLIESVEELQEAINNNVAAYVAALPGKVTYEVKVVPSVIVKGIRLYGETKQIRNGEYADGRPKYKNVTNKFAVVNLYFVKEDGQRSKLITINLGPTDAVRFQPTPQTLQSLEQGVSSGLITSNTDDISVIVSKTPTEVIQVPEEDEQKRAELLAEVERLQEVLAAAQAAQTTSRVPAGYVSPDGAYRFDMGGETRVVYSGNYADALKMAKIFGNPISVNGIKIGAAAPVAAPIKESGSTSSEASAATAQENGSGASTVTPVTTVPYAPVNTAAQKATTLSAYYAALGKPLPSISVRAKIYEQLGLGQAGYYVGSAEQNTKLLYALKNK